MLTNVSAWLSQPFSSNQDATHWFLFIGFLLVGLWLWHMIFRDIARAVD